MLPARFEKKIVRIPFSGCWIWVGASGERYGLSYAGGRTVPAHRAVLSACGVAVPRELEVMHSCDVGFCVNPAHLSVGTHAENMADMVRKGRARAPTGDAHWTRNDPGRAREVARRNIVRTHGSGEANNNAKANAQVAASIRAAHAADPTLTMTELGHRFGLGREQTRKIVKGIAWQ